MISHCCRSLFRMERTVASNGAKPLNTLAVVAIIFFSVAGSPIGIEDAVVAGGPFYALIGLVVMPFVWCIPEAMISAELCTAYPEDAGFVAWVTDAFGETAGYVEGVMSWFSGVTDNAVYPVLIAKYLSTVLHIPDTTSVEYYLLLMGVVLLLAFVNFLGLKVVGNTSMILCVVCLLPFAVMVVMGIPNVDVHRWMDRPVADEVDWGLLLNTLFWNLNYFDSVSTLAAEVRNPARVFPRAMMLGVLVTVLQYLVSVAVAVGVSPPGATWTDSYFSDVGDMVGGAPLRLAIVAAGVLSCIGQFEAEMSADSFEILGLAERRMIPKVFSHRSRFDTPTYGIAVGLVVTIPCCLLDLSDIIELLNVFYIYASLLEFGAFLFLRFRAPHLHRPFKAPVGNYMAVVMLTPTVFFTLLVLVLSSWRAHVIAFAGFLVSIALARSMQYLRRQRPALFHPDLPSKNMNTRHVAPLAVDPDTDPLLPVDSRGKTAIQR